MPVGASGLRAHSFFSQLHPKPLLHLLAGREAQHMASAKQRTATEKNIKKAAACEEKTDDCSSAEGD
jgi:hypothetical protein